MLSLTLLFFFGVEEVCMMNGKARKSLKFLKMTERRELINSVQEKMELFSIKLTSTLNKEYESNRKAMNRNWSNQKANPLLKPIKYKSEFL